MTHIETLKLALEALEIVNREMLTLRDELAERGGRPTQGYHQLLWDSSHKVYTDTAIPAAESLRQAIAEAEQAQPVGTVKVMGSYKGVPALGCLISADGVKVGDNLYTAPPPRKPEPLTPEEILAIRDAHTPHLSWGIKDFARAVIAAYEAKNGITKGEA